MEFISVLLVGIILATGQKCLLQLHQLARTGLEHRNRQPLSRMEYMIQVKHAISAHRTVNGSEDCLYLGLFSRPWSLPQPLHPVMILYFGGGFVEGGSSFIIPPAGYPMIYPH